MFFTETVNSARPWLVEPSQCVMVSGLLKLPRWRERVVPEGFGVRKKHLYPFLPTASTKLVHLLKKHHHVLSLQRI